MFCLSLSQTLKSRLELPTLASRPRPYNLHKQGLLLEVLMLHPPSIRIWLQEAMGLALAGFASTATIDVGRGQLLGKRFSFRNIL